VSQIGKKKGKPQPLKFLFRDLSPKRGGEAGKEREIERGSLSPGGKKKKRTNPGYCCDENKKGFGGRERNRSRQVERARSRRSGNTWWEKRRGVFGYKSHAHLAGNQGGKSPS